MKVVHKIGKFVDYEGNNRKFVMVAVSAKLIDAYVQEYNDSSVFAVNTVDVPKMLSLGVSVCRAEDTFDEKLGIEIATGKAIKNRDHVLYTTSEGLINSKLVEAFLEQEVEFFIKDPGYYIKGYNESKNKYLKKKGKELYIESLPETHRKLFSELVTLDKAEINNMFKLICGDI